VRSQNEDHLGWGRIGVSGDDGAGYVFAVADGLGAYGGGDLASRLAVLTLLDHSAGNKAAADVRVPRLLRSAFDAANREVFDTALRGEGAAKMQTTMSALLLTPGEAHIGHIGDCRAYRLRGDSLELLTSDHTQVMEMLRMRLITQEQAADHPARYALTRSLGGELIVRADIRKETLQEGDTFLLCSDGLWGKLDPGEVHEAMRGELYQACNQLIDRAMERGGEDNATALAIRVVGAGTAPARPQGWRRLFQ
jgi:protein phosphatase